MAKFEASWYEKIGYLFYLVSPNRTSFEKVEDVPNYAAQVGPFFSTLVLLEVIILYIRKKNIPRMNDSMVSLSQGMASEMAKIVLRGFEFAGYIYVYNEWRIASLPWNSLWTWFICFFAVEFGFYCWHRASHEINFMWAAHQVHHSSEDFNVMSALRQSIVQPFIVWIFNLPLALFIPPPVFMVHSQLNLLYQMWIHTEAIDSLGPLEYILNTPSHHRVHHGRNKYCIDKNYGGTLIIFDRLFGTFEPEMGKIAYGLTHPINTFSLIPIQFGHYKELFKRLLETHGLRNKLSILFQGPGWSPGKPRLGLKEDLPEVQLPVETYDITLPQWLKLYVLLHFIFAVISYFEITKRHMDMPQGMVLGATAYEYLSLGTISALLDGRSYAPFLELVRCALFSLIDYCYFPVTRLGYLQSTTRWALTNFLRTCFYLSALLWTCICARTISVVFHKTKVD